MTVPPFNHHGFDQFLAEGKLMGCRCRSCGTLLLPPRPLCPTCYSTDLEWTQFSGQGTLIGFTSIHVGLSRMIAEGYDRDHPYHTAVVRLAEGPTISGQILDGDESDELSVGTPVTAAFIERGDADSVETILAFKREKG